MISRNEYFGGWSGIVDFQEMDRVLNILSKGNTCPLLKDAFRAFHLCSLKDLRVVICGMEPYNTVRNEKSVATGLAFANSPDTPEELYSPSLGILRDSVTYDAPSYGSITFDQSLEKWASQGVLLLNAALTCEAGRAGSHFLLWRPFMKSLFTNLSDCHTGVVYVLMGTEAQSFEPYINSRFNHIIKTRHPSWYARRHETMPSDVWRKIDSILIGQNGYSIEWYNINN